MPKKITDEIVLNAEIEALENALSNPQDRTEYMDDFWSNADLLLRALKQAANTTKKGSVSDAA